MTSNKEVIWIGAKKGVALGSVNLENFLPGTKWLNMPEYFVTHDPNCKYILGRERMWGNPAPRTTANLVPANVRRCKFCGGGR